jgi:ribose 5-phosphate isomerase B
MLYIASDHRGFEFKNKLKEYLTSKNIPFEDMGPHEYVSTDDYPDYAIPTAEKVVANNGLGILACRNGGGMTIAANKVKGARATFLSSIETAKLTKTDDDANIGVIEIENADFDEIFKRVESFISTPFSNAERHVRRRDKVIKYENQ